MPQMTGKDALAQMLIAEGAEFIFGNPGTSETPLLDVLQDYPQLRYIQSLQEGTAVGMADGYARATGRPAFANIHIAGGLANGISALYNAYRGGTPLVLTAGNSDTRMLLTDPTLSGDLVEMTSQYTKWSTQVLHASDIPMAVRRAYKEAKTPPTGPVFISFPWDTMDETGDLNTFVGRILPHPAGYRCRGPGFPATIPSRQPHHRSRRPRGPIRRGRPGRPGGRAVGGQGLRNLDVRSKLPQQPRLIWRNTKYQQPGYPTAIGRSRRGHGCRHRCIFFFPLCV